MRHTPSVLQLSSQLCSRVSEPQTQCKICLQGPPAELSLAVQAACQKNGLSNAAALEELEALLSFTVPLEAADGGKTHALPQWVLALQCCAEGQSSEGGWCNVRVVCEKTTQRMQL